MADGAARFLALLDGMANRPAEIRDYTCVFTKQERIGEELHPMETVFLKHRGPGVCVYMKWIAEPHEGRELIYCESRYDGRLKVHEGAGVASWFTLSLDPLGSLATRGSRRPVTQAGIYNAIGFMVRGFDQARNRGETKGFEKVDEREVHGQRSLCAVVIPPRGDDSSGERIGKSELCIHEDLRLPTLQKIWNEMGEVIGVYTYRDFRLNVGLADRDFDVDNEQYGF